MFDLFCFLRDLPDPIEAVDLKICNDALDDLIGLEAGEGYDDGEFEYERAECRYRQNDEPHKNEVVLSTKPVSPPPETMPQRQGASYEVPIIETASTQMN